MGLSKKSVEVLLDLLEIKLSCIEISDRDDAREVKVLERARRELAELAGGGTEAEIIPLPTAPQPHSRAV